MNTGHNNLYTLRDELLLMNEMNGLPSIARMDLNLFRVFEVVFRERNLTRSAAILHVSQSAVSHSLARLREQFTDPLFVREGRGVSPTALAQRLAPVISDSLARLQRTLEGLQDFDPSADERTFTISLPEQLELVLLPPLLVHLRHCAPGCRVRIAGVRWSELKLEMAAGRIDLAVQIARPVEASLRQTQLLTEPLCVVAGPCFSGVLSIERYLESEHIAVASWRRGLSYEDLALGHMGLMRRVVQQCQNYQAASLVVAQSDLLLTMSRRHAELVNAVLDNQLLEMPLPLPAIGLNLYWHETSEHDSANRWLREQVCALAQNNSSGVTAPSLE
ncbi:MAG: DNA-binding transcriptional LysR family regulator [Halopseudomonas sp.]|jgi:DNA-binding transcriptional LysR family regulator